MQWDDLRFVLAVHRNGSLAGAGRELAVSHVTVSRRIEAIEADLAVRLFDRKTRGYEATSAGLEIVEQAARIEEQIRSLETRVWGRDRQVQGTVRLTATDSFASVVLPPILSRLREAHPLIRLELVVVNDLVNMAKRDADVAIRGTRAPPEMLVGRRVGTLVTSAFVSEDFAREHELDEHSDLSLLPWVGLDDSFSGGIFNQWLKSEGHDGRVVYACNSFMALASAVKAGLGVGMMSWVMAKQLGGVVRVGPPVEALENDIWVLIHPELREVARAAAVYSFLHREMSALMGGAPVPDEA